METFSGTLTESSSSMTSLDLKSFDLSCEQDILQYVAAVCEDEDTEISSAVLTPPISLSLNTYEVLLTQLLPKCLLRGKLVRLSLANSNLNAKVAAFVSHLLSLPGKLTSLDLSGNCLGDLGAACIASAFKELPLQERASLNLISLSTLNLSANSITDTGAVALTRGISAFIDQCRDTDSLSPNFDTLKLDNNALGDSAAVGISQLLRKFPARNLHLKELSLNGNKISEKGMIALLKAVMDSKQHSLKTLRLCNNQPSIAVLHHIGDMYMNTQIQPSELALEHLEIPFCQLAAKKIISDDLVEYTQALLKIQNGLTSADVHLTCLCIGELQLETFQSSLNPALSIEDRKMLQLAIEILDSIDIIHHWVAENGPSLQIDVDDVGYGDDVNTGIVSIESEDPCSPLRRLPTIEDISNRSDEPVVTPPKQDDKDAYLQRLRERSAKKFSEASKDIQKLINTSSHRSVASAQSIPNERDYIEVNASAIRTPSSKISSAERNTMNPMISRLHEAKFKVGEEQVRSQIDGAFTITSTEFKKIVNNAVTTALESVHKEWFSQMSSSPPSYKEFQMTTPKMREWPIPMIARPTFAVDSINKRFCPPTQIMFKKDIEEENLSRAAEESKKITSIHLEKKIVDLEKKIAVLEKRYGDLDQKVANLLGFGVVSGTSYDALLRIATRLQDLDVVEKRMIALETAVENEHKSSIHVLDILLQKQLLQTAPNEELVGGKVKKQVSIIEDRNRNKNRVDRSNAYITTSTSEKECKTKSTSTSTKSRRKLYFFSRP